MFYILTIAFPLPDTRIYEALYLIVTHSPSAYHDFL